MAQHEQLVLRDVYERDTWVAAIVAAMQHPRVLNHGVALSWADKTIIELRKRIPPPTPQAAPQERPTPQAASEGEVATA